MLIFINPSDSQESSDISHFANGWLLLMAILMFLLVIYDIKGAVSNY